MASEVIFRQQTDYLLVEVHCEWTVENAKEIIDRVRSEAEERGLDRVLLDLTEWASPPSEMVRFYSGEYLAQTLRPTFKVASFAKQEHINKYGETVAVNRGARYAIFPNRSDALDWLLN